MRGLGIGEDGVKLARNRHSSGDVSQHVGVQAIPMSLLSERASTVVVVVAPTFGFVAALLLGGPRLGYLAGIPLSAVVVLTILWRYTPSLHIRWLAATLVAAYCAGGALVIGDDVLAHVSFGSDGLRYDRGLHMFGAAVTVLLIAEIADRRHPMGTTLVMVIAVVAGLLVESVELVNALALPNLFSYDLGDSSLDVVGNFAGLGVGLVALLWAKR